MLGSIGPKEVSNFIAKPLEISSVEQNERPITKVSHQSSIGVSDCQLQRDSLSLRGKPGTVPIERHMLRIAGLLLEPLLRQPFPRGINGNRRLHVTFDCSPIPTNRMTPFLLLSTNMFLILRGCRH